LLCAAHVPPFSHAHVAHPVPVSAPAHSGVATLNVQFPEHVLHGPFITLPLKHSLRAPHHPHPDVFAQWSALPMAPHLGSHGISTPPVSVFTLGVDMIGGIVFTHRSASKSE
jgi:hypothetical protein|tara:strand:- start:679 stop:1014 length:336 start_codon:yes stop_codon:yes gene_type:complete